MPFPLRHHAKVRPAVHHLLAYFCRAASKHFPCRADVEVVPRPVGYVVDREHGRCAGVYYAPDRFCMARIVLAAGPSISLDAINLTAWHEARHHWQHITGQRLDEDGMDRDASVHAKDLKAWMVKHGQWPEEE